MSHRNNDQRTFVPGRRSNHNHSQAEVALRFAWLKHRKLYNRTKSSKVSAQLGLQLLQKNAGLTGSHRLGMKQRYRVFSLRKGSWATAQAGVFTYSISLKSHRREKFYWSVALCSILRSDWMGFDRICTHFKVIYEFFAIATPGSKAQDRYHLATVSECILPRSWISRFISTTLLILDLLTILSPASKTINHVLANRPYRYWSDFSVRRLNKTSYRIQLALTSEWHVVPSDQTFQVLCQQVNNNRCNNRAITSMCSRCQIIVVASPQSSLSFWPNIAASPQRWGDI